jgi:alpha,alpha-trehalase
MYPWQSGSNGREESQRLHLNPRSGRWIPDDSHRQRHIGAAIAYNVWQYHQVTADDEFLFRYGAEMLLEIARFWASLAAWDPALERYRIRGVMGPDEYHTAYPDAPPEAGGLDDNAYTNVMAAWVLARARDVLELLPRGHRERLVEALALDEAEVESWLRISRRLRVPFHGDGIISQFDGYERLEELDWAGYRERYGDIQRLDRILEAEDDTPNRYKASKQADVLMLFYLFSSEELALLFEQLGYAFDQDLIPRNIRYYLERTSHGSTLSFMVHSWVLARSDRPRAWALFKDALASDFVDIQGGTTPEGIHLGAMAGTLDLVQRCLTGIETRANVLHFNPALPEPLRRVELELRYRGHELRVTVTHDLLRVASEPVTAEPITLAYRGHFRDLSPGQTWTVPLLRPEEKPA